MKAANGDVALGASLLMLLLVVTIVYMPIVVPLMLPEAKVSAASIAKPLLWTMVLPLLVGHFVEAKFRSVGEAFSTGDVKVSNVALVVLLVTTFFANLHEIIAVRQRSDSCGNTGRRRFLRHRLFARKHRPWDARCARAWHGQRNIAAATVVATQGFDDPDILIMVVVTSLVTMAVLFPTAKALRKRGEKRRRMHSTKMREA